MQLTAPGSRQRTRGKEGLTPPFIARGYAVIGDADEAFAWLERGYSERNHGLLVLKVDSVASGIRCCKISCHIGCDFRW